MERCKGQYKCTQQCSKTHTSQSNDQTAHTHCPQYARNDSRIIFTYQPDYSPPERQYHTTHNSCELDQQPIRIPTFQNYTFSNRNFSFDGSLNNIKAQYCNKVNNQNYKNQYCQYSNNVILTKQTCSANHYTIPSGNQLSNNDKHICSCSTTTSQIKKSILSTTQAPVQCDTKQIKQITNCKSCGGSLEKTTCGLAMTFDLNICPKCVPKTCTCSKVKSIENQTIKTAITAPEQSSKTSETIQPENKSTGTKDSEDTSLNSIGAKTSNVTIEEKKSDIEIESFTEVAKPEIPKISTEENKNDNLLISIESQTANTIHVYENAESTTNLGTNSVGVDIPKFTLDQISKSSSEAFASEEESSAEER